MLAAVIADRAVRADERPDPVPGTGEVLVRVRAAGLNNADLIQVQGGYPAPPGSPPDIPGLEFAGVVERVGGAVTEVAPGDRVFGVAGGGAQAQYLTVPAVHCAPVPADLDLLAMGGHIRKPQPRTK